MKKILIVNHFPSIHTYSYINALKQYSNCDVDLLMGNVYKEEKMPPADKLMVYNIFPKLRPLKLSIILSTINLSIKFLFLRKRYDCIEMHYPDVMYFPIYLFSKLKSKRLGICFWGDDYKKMPALYKRLYNYYLYKTDYIITGNIGYFNEIKDNAATRDKVHLVGFGSDMFDEIDRQYNDKSKIKSKLGIDDNAIVVTCSHNASRSVNHKIVIEQIQKVSCLNNNVVYLFLMTYPVDTDYVQAIKNSLESTKLSYMIIDRYLSKDEIVNFRVISDVFIHIQNQDSFSLSMVEYLYCGNIVINGKWLNYNDFEAMGGYYLKCDRDNLFHQVENAIDNIDYHKSLTLKNKDIILDLKGWKKNIERWEKLY